MKRLSRPAAAALTLLLAACLLLTACQRPENLAPPADLLSREKTISLLAEMHLLEARVENARLAPDSARALYQAQQKNLLWQASVSDSVFLRSYRYYSIHGKDLDEIYAAVIDSLGQREFRMGMKK